MICKLCKNETTGNKPYCIDHLNCMPSVYALTDKLNARENDIERAALWGEVDLSGLFAYEILELLHKRGPHFIEEIVNELDAPIEAISAYMDNMLVIGLVTKGGTNSYKLTKAGRWTLSDLTSA